MNDFSDDFDPGQYIPQPRPSIFRSATANPPAANALQDGLEPSVEFRPVLPRQPHLGYTLAVLLIGGLMMVVAALLIFGIGSAVHLLPPLSRLRSGGALLPKASLLIEGTAYLGTAAVGIALFRRMWGRSFADVLQLGFAVAKRNAGKLALLGVVTSIAAQLAEAHMTLPKQMPIENFFRSPGTVWIVAFFGVFVAPPAEELFFRGFLLRSVAIAYDWIRTRVDPESRLLWARTDSLSRPAWIFSGILTSIIFAVMHAAQLGFAWNAVAVLTLVGGVLTAVRLHFKSVAASTAVHMAYNGFIFAVLFVATGGFQHLDKIMDR